MKATIIKPVINLSQSELCPINSISYCIHHIGDDWLAGT